MAARSKGMGKFPRGTNARAESLRLAKEAVRYLNAFIAYMEPIIEQEIATKEALARGGNFTTDEPDGEM